MNARTVTWAEAVGAIAGRLAGLPGVVGVTGPQGSGKSTLAARLAGAIAGSVVVSTDRYLPDYARLRREEYDLPEHADLALLAAQVAALRTGQAVEAPVWSFVAHARTGRERIGPASAGVVIIEGIHALAGAVREAVDVAVFVEAPAPVRLGRVVARELAGERGWSAEEAAAFMTGHADPVFERFAGAYRAGADVVVVNAVDGVG